VAARTCELLEDEFGRAIGPASPQTPSRCTSAEPSRLLSSAFPALVLSEGFHKKPRPVPARGSSSGDDRVDLQRFQRYWNLDTSEISTMPQTIVRAERKTVDCLPDLTPAEGSIDAYYGRTL
jgi:hypothetical protein